MNIIEYEYDAKKSINTQAKKKQRERERKFLTEK